MVPVSASAGTAIDRAGADIVTAQRVAIKRNLPAVLQEAKALATAAGQRFYYSIPFSKKIKGENGEKDRWVKEYVEGIGINGAMAALNTYGNCRVEAFVAHETATSYQFMARFTDLEKGVTVTRAFQQRKNMNTGMKDAARQEDIIFQIGQSKAIRNVIDAGLGWLCDEMFAAAKAGIVERVGKNLQMYRDKVLDRLDELGISLDRVEPVVGRSAGNWLAPDVAKLIAQVQAIQEGLAAPDDLFPADQDEQEALRNASERSDGNGAPQGGETEQKAEQKPKQTRQPRQPKQDAPKEQPKQDQQSAPTTGPAPEQQQKPADARPAQQQNDPGPGADDGWPLDSKAPEPQAAAGGSNQPPRDPPQQAASQEPDDDDGGQGWNTEIQFT